jgi:subtilisin family serine protease
VCAGVCGGVSRAQRGAHHAEKISPELRALLRASGGGSRVNVIVQQSDATGPNLDALLNRFGGRITRKFGKLKAQAVSLPPQAIEALAARGDVRYVSPDREVGAAGHVEATTGTGEVRVQSLISLLGITTTTTLDGEGVGIAVVDSGIDAGHAVFRDGLGLSRVAASVDFTGEGRTDDPFGHGTHVASIAAGSGQPSGGAYTGVAPGAKLVNLRVLDSEGRGTSSGLLSALEWVLNNRTLYNIRVVNLSLGAAAVEDYRDDPVCRAVRRLVDAGVLVVAAAGNSGKDAAGNKIYGQIHAPGDEPAALTVGASNTFGTDARSDDAVTTYSSRGPTRGGWTDSEGGRHYDNLIKPELVAPGNRIVGAAAANNSILAAHPELLADPHQPASRRMMYLSGTSMATPVTAGAAALLLQANSSLTPNLVKAILMYTAQPLAGANMLEQGAGELNVEGAVRVARLVRPDLSGATPLGAPLLSGPLPPVPQTSIAGGTFSWSQGLVLNHTYAGGDDLLTLYQRVYGTGCVLGDGVVEGDTTQTPDASLMTGGVVLGNALFTSDGSALGSGGVFLDTGALLGGTLADGIMVGDGVLVGDGIMVGDGVMVGDTTFQAQSAMIDGDDTACMK